MENAALGSDRQRHAAGKRARVNWSRWATWTAGFIAFPIAGLAAGWSVTTAIGVDVERQYVVFGSAGAITVMAVLGLLWEWIRAGGRRPFAA